MIELKRSKRVPPPSEARANAHSVKLIRRPWLWLNLLCLDAPIVAVTWLWLFARALDLPLAVASMAALFLTAWLIYLADRLADTFKLDLSRETSLRHRFCTRHRRAWIGTMVTVAVADAWALSQLLDPLVLKAGAIIAAVAFAYLLVNYAASRVWRALPVKELTIGSLFAAGTLTALMPRVDLTEGPLLLTIGLFAVLCALNCICIAFWERPIDQAQRRESIATTWPAGAKYLVPVSLSVTGIAMLASRWSVPLALIDSCVALSAILLGALHALRHVLGRDSRAALGDLVLLTPILMLLLLL